MHKPPAFLKKYFWDIDFNKLNPQKNPQYAIERILELGDTKAVRWVYKNFNHDIIRKAVCQSRTLSQKTASFWSLILKIPKKDILCLQSDSQKIHKPIWPY